LSRLRLPCPPAALLALALLSGRPAAAAPATQAEMELYTRLASLNVCVARAAGVEFEQAVSIAAETITEWIRGTHASSVAPVSSSPLGLEDLRRGSVNAAVIGAAELCADLVPERVRGDVERVVKPTTPPPTARP
jgi:hypothetical protein